MAGTTPIEMGMDKLRDKLTEAVEAARYGARIHITTHGRLMCVMMSPEAAARCFEALDRANEPRK